MSSQTTIHSTTQDFLDIYDITNNIVLLKDGSASMVLSVNAMNFGLLAEQEQDAIIYTYAALLNSLNYPIQILVQSQTKDATIYLELLKKQEEKATSQNKKQRIARYRTFVSQLIKERNVLDKKFYVVVSASSLEMGLLPIQTVIPGTKAPDVSTIEKTLFLERALTILEPRRDHLLGQFNRIGLFARQMATQEIIQVFYNNYNPEAAEGQQITDSTNYTTPLVKASTNGGFMNTQPAQTPAPTPPSTPSTPTATPPPAAAPAQSTTPPSISTQPTPTTMPNPTTPTPATTVEPPSITETITPLNIPQDENANHLGTDAMSPVATPQAPTPSLTTAPSPSTPTPGMDTTPQPDAPATNTNTSMTPSTPPMSPTPGVEQTDAEKKAQEAIDSTLKNLTPGVDTTPTSMTSSAPSGVTPPPTVNPVPVSGATNDAMQNTATNNMPPLPEI